MVCKEDITKLETNLTEWITNHFNVEGKLAYFKELTQTTVLFCVCANPFSKLSRDGPRHQNLFVALEVEDAVEKEIPFQSHQEGTDQLLEHGGNLKFEPVPDYPFFQTLFQSLADIHASSIGICPNYIANSGHYRQLLKRFFQAHRWFSTEEIDEHYSEYTFGNWRRIISYADGSVALIALAEGVNLSREIQTAPTFLRILDIVNSFGAFVNDLLGMRKEFNNNQKDSLILFKVLQKKIPLEVAVQQVCALLESELEDYMLMKQVILKEFNNDADLVKYLNILESFMDGHNRIYAMSKRHCAVGCITLTRNC